jgi:hypothetical protein
LTTPATRIDVGAVCPTAVVYGESAAWVAHDYQGRLHMSLGPDIPQPSVSPPVPLHGIRHRQPAHLHVETRPMLGGLHPEYGLKQKAA